MGGSTGWRPAGKVMEWFAAFSWWQGELLRGGDCELNEEKPPTRGSGKNILIRGIASAKTPRWERENCGQRTASMPVCHRA